MIFFKATVHLTQMGLAVPKPLMVLLPLDVTRLHYKSILGAVTAAMSLLKAFPGYLEPAQGCFCLCLCWRAQW